MHTVCIDFDGPIHLYGQGRHDDTIYDVPTPGAFEAIDAIQAAGHAVVIFSARDIVSIAAWMPDRFDCVIDDGSHIFWYEPAKILITNRKLPCWVYIDDRAITFKNWPDALQALRWTN